MILLLPQFHCWHFETEHTSAAIAAAFIVTPMRVEHDLRATKFSITFYILSLYRITFDVLPSVVESFWHANCYYGVFTQARHDYGFTSAVCRCPWSWTMFFILHCVSE